MSDIRNLSGVSVDTGSSAPVSEMSDAGEVPEESQLAFDDALGKGSELNESQSPETRKAIKRSLDRFQASHETEGASGSSESGVADASQRRSTRLTASRLAGAVAKDGRVSTRETRKAADAGGEDAMSAQARSRRKGPASPPVGAADAGGEAPVSAQGRSQRNGSTSPPVGDGGNRGAPASSRLSTKRSPATADGTQSGATAEGVLARGQARAGPAVEAARTTPTKGAQAVSPRVPSGPSASPTEGIVSGPGADDAHDPDTAAIDMTGVAASAGTAELGRASAPEGVQTPASHASELAEQVADRILVSMPDSSAPGEVRISLKQSILDGSDVRIFHEGGELKVVFVAETESAQRLLVNIKEQFQQTLGERLQDQRVRVEVEAPARGGASREDGRGRSRQQYVGQDDSSGAS